MFNKLSLTMTTSQKTFSQEEYDKHGNILYEIGKASAFQSVLKTEVQWSVKMSDENWDLDTIIIGDGTLKNITFIKPVYTQFSNGKYGFVAVKSIAKNGTVREVWLASDRAFKKAKKQYGDWHYFLEQVELDKDGDITSFYGS